MTTRIISNEELTLRWGELAPWVAEALEKGLGDRKPHNLLMNCLSGWGQCWLNEVDGELHSVAITEIVSKENHNELIITTTSGKGWARYGREALTMIEEFAKQAGCKYTAIYGRKGWAKMLPDYHEPYTLLMKEIV